VFYLQNLNKLRENLMPSTSALSEAHLPTMEETMHRNPFEIIDSPWGRIECWRAATLATGTMGALAQVAAIVRNDAAELREKAVAFDAKKASVLRTVNKLLNFMSRVDALTARMDALEAKLKADEEQQCEFEEEPLTLPPDISEKQTLAPPAELGAHSSARIGDDTHQPGGELHNVAPKDEPPLEDSDNIGDLPKELEEPVDPVPKPQGTVYPQPTALFGS
jgi:hypothetical protein